jgi:DNA-binding helix-hairpin-helix protein with protein kinase domain
MTLMLIGLLIAILSLTGFVISIIVLIKSFKHGGVLHGILGIITCGFYTFIWGWIKSRSLQMTKLMVTWTLIPVVCIGLYFVVGLTMLGEVYQMWNQLMDNPSMTAVLEQTRVMNPAPEKKGAPINLSNRGAKNTAAEKNDDWNARAMALWEDGKYSDPNQAKNYWDRAIAANPKLAESYNNRGLAFYNLELYQQAINDFSQAIRMKPQYAEAFNNRGNAYYALDQYQLAEADFNKSLQLRPRYANAHLNRGLVYFQMKKIEESCKNFRKACDLGDCDGLQWAMQNGHCK